MSIRVGGGSSSSSSSGGGAPLAYAEKNDANFTTTSTSWTPVTGLALSFTAPSRAYLVRLEAAVTNSNPGSYGQLALEESVNGGTTWTQLAYQVSRAPQGSTSLTLTLTRQRNPGGGTAVQYRATLNAAAGGTAAVVVDPNASLPSFAVLYAT